MTASWVQYRDVCRPGRRGAAPAARPGYTLLEVLVAAVILTMVAVIALAVISSSLFTTRRVDSRIDAQTLAGDVLARAAAGALGALPATGQIQRSDVSFEWRVDAKSTTGALTTLRCVVRWSLRGQPRSYELDRLAILPTEESP